MTPASYHWVRSLCVRLAIDRSARVALARSDDTLRLSAVAVERDALATRPFGAFAGVVCRPVYCKRVSNIMLITIHAADITARGEASHISRAPRIGHMCR